MSKEKSMTEMLKNASKEKREEYKLISWNNAKEAKRDVRKLKIRDTIKKLILTGDLGKLPTERDRDLQIIRYLRMTKIEDIVITSICLNPYLKCSERYVRLGEEAYKEDMDIITNEMSEAMKKTTLQRDKINKIRSWEASTAVKLKAIQQYIVKDLFYTEEMDALIDEDEKRFYIFEKIEKILMEVELVDFYCYIRDRYGIAATEWKEIQDAIITEIWKNGRRIEAYNFCFFDKQKFILYISDNNNGIYRLNGEEIEHVDNGVDRVFFKYETEYKQFELDEDVKTNYFERIEKVKKDNLIFDNEKLGLSWEEFTSKGSLVKEFLIDKTNFDDEEGFDIEGQQQLLLIYYYSLFFESILTEKPILVFMGRRESGKSFIAESMGKILFGERFRTRSIPAKIGDIKVLLGESYYVTFDNIDHTVKGEVLDLLCQTATGIALEKRKLYTDHDRVKAFPKVFIIITSREGRFRRDDLVSRFLLLKTKKITKIKSRTSLLQELNDNRDAILTETLINLNTIVKILKKEKDNIPECVSRTADWETFGRKIWCDFSGRTAFTTLLERQNEEKDYFSLEDDILYQLLDYYINEKGEELENESSRGIFYKLRDVAIDLGCEREFERTYGSPRSIGKRLVNIQDELKKQFNLEIYGKKGKQKTYYIKPIENEDE